VVIGIVEVMDKLAEAVEVVGQCPIQVKESKSSRQWSIKLVGMISCKDRRIRWHRRWKKLETSWEVGKPAKTVEIWRQVVNNFMIVIEVSGEAGHSGK
jgi:hypothetical protein